MGEECLRRRSDTVLCTSSSTVSRSPRTWSQNHHDRSHGGCCNRLYLHVFTVFRLFAHNIPHHNGSLVVPIPWCGMSVVQRTGAVRSVVRRIHLRLRRRSAVSDVPRLIGRVMEHSLQSLMYPNSLDEWHNTQYSLWCTTTHRRVTEHSLQSVMYPDTLVEWWNTHYSLWCTTTHWTSDGTLTTVSDVPRLTGRVTEHSLQSLMYHDPWSSDGTLTTVSDVPRHPGRDEWQNTHYSLWCTLTHWTRRVMKHSLQSHYSLWCTLTPTTICGTFFTAFSTVHILSCFHSSTLTSCMVVCCLCFDSVSFDDFIISM